MNQEVITIKGHRFKQIFIADTELIQIITYLNLPHINLVSSLLTNEEINKLYINFDDRYFFIEQNEVIKPVSDEIVNLQESIKQTQEEYSQSLFQNDPERSQVLKTFLEQKKELLTQLEADDKSVGQVSIANQLSDYERMEHLSFNLKFQFCWIRRKYLNFNYKEPESSLEYLRQNPVQSSDAYFIPIQGYNDLICSLILDHPSHTQIPYYGFIAIDIMNKRVYFFDTRDYTWWFYNAMMDGCKNWNYYNEQPKKLKGLLIISHNSVSIDGMNNIPRTVSLPEASHIFSELIN